MMQSAIMKKLKKNKWNFNHLEETRKSFAAVFQNMTAGEVKQKAWNVLSAFLEHAKGAVEQLFWSLTLNEQVKVHPGLYDAL